jgi:hypothetical protein
MDKLGGESWHAITFPLTIASFDDEILSFDVTEFDELLTKRLDATCNSRRVTRE